MADQYLISDDFEGGKSTVTRLSDLPDDKLRLLAQQGSTEAFRVLLERKAGAPTAG